GDGLPVDRPDRGGGTEVCEPETSIGTGRDVEGVGFRTEARTELRDPPSGADATDRLGAALVGDPEVSVGTGEEVVRDAAGIQAGAELGDHATRRDAPDRGRVGVGEPQIAVRA